MYRKSAQKQELQFTVDIARGPPQTNKKQGGTKFKEGVQLTDKQREYLLPHFTMLVVGKPGSGKTSVIKQMLTDPDYYLHKFDLVLIVSPSASKMGIPIKKDNMNQNFDLGWIEDKLYQLNKKQAQLMAARLKELNIIEKFDVEKLNGHLMDTLQTDMTRNGLGVVSEKVMPNLYADKERFFNKTIKRNITQQIGGSKEMSNRSVRKNGKTTGVTGSGESRVDLVTYVDQMYQELYTKLPPEDRQMFQKNCLVILDDVISQIKANEFNPLLTQLIFNRRHLLLGGTISLMIVSQKYTMIPARVRSNANWMLLFRLNPVDFDTVFKDVVMLPQDQWQQLLDYVFGGVEKKYNSLGIWVESDEYFMNFSQINMQQAAKKSIE